MEARWGIQAAMKGHNRAKVNSVSQCHASQGRIVSRMTSKNIFENHPE